MNHQRKPLTIALSILCIAILGYYINAHFDEFKNALGQMKVSFFLLALLSVALQWTCRIIRDKMMFNELNYHVPFWGLMYVYAQQNILNYLPAKAGTIYSAAALKQKYGVSLTHFGAAFAAQNILTLAMILVSAGFALLSVNLPETVHKVPASIALIVCGMGLIAVLFLRVPKWLSPTPRIQKIIDQLHIGMDALSKHKKLLIMTTCLSLLGALLTAWRMQLLLSSTVGVSFGTALVLAAVVMISVVVSFTPAGLGVREALVGATSNFLALSATAGVIVSTLDRIVILTFVGMIFLAQSVAQLFIRERHGNT
jgi:uncharacterized membrane protein YbhN (UPF0104 family)